jgi:hypothetical protein
LRRPGRRRGTCDADPVERAQRPFEEADGEESGAAGALDAANDLASDLLGDLLDVVAAEGVGGQLAAVAAAAHALSSRLILAWRAAAAALGFRRE